MCGIAGSLSISKGNYKIKKKLLEKMRDSMIHRGPDGYGVWISDDEKVGFDHRRLSIIDLSKAANQPMSNADESVWITYNGEIYNHKELRKELGNKYKWKTDHSDTEVIIHAYNEWGIDFIHKLRGMFAIALWDNKKEELFLIRDRVGIKPLYYTIQENRIVFASEIKAILKDLTIKREVDEESLYHYLSFLTTPAPNTLFKNIKKLPGGCFLKINKSGKKEITRYWDVWKNDKQEKTSKINLAEKIQESLRESVTVRKVSDVPVGVFLSGGIDSSTNAALFSEG